MSLRPGLYVIRYAGARDRQRPPRLLVQGHPGAMDKIALLDGPDILNGVLGVGNVVAVSVRETAAIVITTFSDLMCTSDDVDIKIDLVGAPSVKDPVDQPALTAIRPVTPAIVPAAAPAKTIEEWRIEIHAIASDGRLLVSDESGRLDLPPDVPWVGSLRLDWKEAPDGVALRYRAYLSGKGGTSFHESGRTAGARNRVHPLVGAAVELVGPRAGRYELRGKATFKGGATVELRGSKVEFGGPLGMVPLRSLTLGLFAGQRAEAAPLATSAVQPPTFKVFRSGTVTSVAAANRR